MGLYVKIHNANVVSSSVKSSKKDKLVLVSILLTPSVGSNDYKVNDKLHFNLKLDWIIGAVTNNFPIM